MSAWPLMCCSRGKAIQTLQWSCQHQPARASPVSRARVHPAPGRVVQMAILTVQSRTCGRRRRCRGLRCCPAAAGRPSQTPGTAAAAAGAPRARVTPAAPHRIRSWGPASACFEAHMGMMLTFKGWSTVIMLPLCWTIAQGYAAKSSNGRLLIMAGNLYRSHIQANLGKQRRK